MLIYCAHPMLAKLLVPRWQAEPLTWDIVYAIIISSLNIGLALGIGLVFCRRRCVIAILLLLWAITVGTFVAERLHDRELLPWLVIAEYSCAIASLTTTAAQMAYLTLHRSSKMRSLLVTLFATAFVTAPFYGHLGYMMLIEPIYTFAQQRFAWSCGLGFVASCLLLMIIITRKDGRTHDNSYEALLTEGNSSMRRP